MSKTFQYVFIPADSSAPVKTRTGDTSGGLTDDELVKNAKQYFFEQSGGAAKARALKEASPEDRQALVQQFRDSQASNPQMQKLEDAQILSFLDATNSNPNCEIMALTVPTKGNNYQAISMYVSETGDKRNERASNLVAMSGHRLPEAVGQKTAGVYGDVFVGRCLDDEGRDDWLRVDFTELDLEERADWIQIARAQGGGGGSGASNVASLTGTMGQLKTKEEDLGYTWTQTVDEVELKFAVAANIRGKDVNIKFSRSSLTVKVAGETLLEGPTGGAVVVDDSTYTLQDDDKGGRELCLIMGKHDEGRTWAYAVKK